MYARCSVRVYATNTHSIPARIERALDNRERILSRTTVEVNEAYSENRSHCYSAGIGSIEMHSVHSHSNVMEFICGFMHMDGCVTVTRYRRYRIIDHADAV